MKKIGLLKRMTAALSALALLLLAFTACGGEKYPMRPSTVEEQETVFTLGEDAVPFEVLHTFFTNTALSQKDYAEGYFYGAEGEARFSAVMEAAIADIAEIYALFAACRAAGIDPYSEEINKTVASYVEKNMEGGSFSDYYLPSFEDYDAYLAYLKTNYHMNDSVSRLLLRFAACEEALIQYYNESVPHSEETVREFFLSENCIHVNWFRQVGYTEGKGLTYESAMALMQSAKDRLNVAGSDSFRQEQVFIDSFPPATQGELENGFYIGKNTWDPAYLGELTEMAFALSDYTVSEIFEAKDGGLYLVYRLPKDPADLTANYNTIESLYLSECMYTAIAEKKASLMAGISYAEGFSSLAASDLLAD